MRIEGTTIPENKRAEVALTYLYGIGRSLANKILEKAKISKDKKIKDFSEKETSVVRDLIKNYKIESELKRSVHGNIKRLQEIKSYRGTRHSRNLPVRGQRTKTNSRTNRPYRGRKTMTSGRRKAEKK